MRLFRTLLLSLLVVAGGFSASAGVSYAVDKPACTYQGMSEQDCNNCDATATACVSCSVGCTHGAIPSAATARADDPAAGNLTAHSAAPISSLTLAPEEAPPKRSII